MGCKSTYLGNTASTGSTARSGAPAGAARGVSAAAEPPIGVPPYPGVGLTERQCALTAMRSAAFRACLVCAALVTQNVDVSYSAEARSLLIKPSPRLAPRKLALCMMSGGGGSGEQDELRSSWSELRTG